ncbi:MAG: 3-isopropylmalate dehydratase large subunit [Rhizobiales bacterium]|nr:3-isopropylmalate dehydratase large subunit [Hyphomicrobiales bacterium]MBO6698846.1 3-isopropylmalate dehydratase large subunit [Hyphomicrobiales bacterium]MBO6734901.1 3-isopropylmalate dehydratase large subunit [Hyphomicrobiales bacterium]MBO6911293.1 3-isopropylmalate dehydratase large subunit [Hyphomicrobiales bacterium]MBO6956209.1 3-isopropylmalate dehydratase large subunit [Hyphomicrobiales bacterium]
MSGQTLFDRLWSSHEVLRRDDGASLLWVDRHLVHEGSHHAFGKLAERGLKVAHPELTIAVSDHYVPTRERASGGANDDIRRMIATLESNAKTHSIRHFGLSDPRQGIVHVAGPEQGLTLPGLMVVCGDSHTSTHGAFGVFAFGIGATEVAHVLATQTLWQTRPKTMRLTFNGTLAEGVTAKDMALHWIAKLGSDGARGHAIEYAGSAVRALSMEARMTLCNLSIEGGAKCGMIEPDATTFAYLKGRPFAPSDNQWDEALDDWQSLASNADATFDREIDIDAGDVAPTVTWGIVPEQAVPISGTVPANAPQEALDYMGLRAGQALKGLPIDQVFIGSCTNARIEDLRAAAAAIAGHRAKVPGIVSPGSMIVKRLAEAEGLDRIFIDAGLDWVASGCSMCVAMNGDVVAPGKRCASTTNRNFRGRQGPGARTHLMSPAMVAAAAVAGELTDARALLKNRPLAGAA